MKKQLLFKVTTGDLSKKETVKEYRVYTDGTVKGFDKGAVVSNYYPNLLAFEVERAVDKTNHGHIYG